MAKDCLYYIMHACMACMSYKQEKRLTLDLKTLILLVLCFITKSGVKPKLGKLNEGIDYPAPEMLLGLACSRIKEI